MLSFVGCFGCGVEIDLVEEETRVQNHGSSFWLAFANLSLMQS
jgi:hypothetical protein